MGWRVEHATSRNGDIDVAARICNQIVHDTTDTLDWLTVEELANSSLRLELQDATVQPLRNKQRAVLATLFSPGFCQDCWLFPRGNDDEGP